MFWLIPAVVATTLASGYMQSKAASKAAAAQTKANTQATAESARQFDAQMAQYRLEQDAALQRYYATQSALSPYTQTGTSALTQQRALIGLDPDREAMIKQANAEYDRAVAAAQKATQTYQGAKTSAAPSSGGPGGIAGVIDSGMIGKPGTTASGGASELEVRKQEALNAIKRYQLDNPNAWMDPEKAAFIKSSYDNIDKMVAEGVQGESPGAIESGSKNQAGYDKAVSDAEAARQKAIDYANSLPSGSEAQKAAIAAIEQGSEMTTLAKQGEEAILSNASATGGLRGGNTQGALAQFRPSLLNSLINQQYERLGSLSGMGMSSILGGAGYSGASTSYPSGQNTIDLILSQGSINAGNAMAQGNAWASVPNALSAGLGMYGAMGGFGSSTYNRPGATAVNSGYNIPGYMQGSLTSPF